MDPIKPQSLKHFSEMQELLTSSSSSCRPLVISSLRQLQSVTEGGVAGRKRRRSCIQKQRIIASLCEGMGRSDNTNKGTAGMETNSGAWGISAVTTKYQFLLPCAVLEKVQNFNVTETDNTKVNEVSGEGSTGSVPALQNVVTEALAVPERNAARWRRFDGGSMKIVFDDETAKEGIKCSGTDETPTRAPSQRSIVEKEALSNTNCAAKNMRIAARTSRRRSQVGEGLTSEVTRADNKPALEVADGRNTRGNTRLEVALSEGANEGARRSRDIFCNTSSAGEQHSVVVEAQGRITQTHSQSNLQRAFSALLERESSSSGLGGAGPNNRWNLSGDTVKMVREEVRRLRQLPKQESHHSEDEHQISPTSCLRWTKDEVEGEACNYQLQKAKPWQLHKAKPWQLHSSLSAEATSDERNPKGQACSDDGLHILGACNGEEKTNIALPHSERQSQRDSDANKAEPRVVVLPVDRQSPPFLSLLGGVDRHFSYPLCREGEIPAPDGQPDATGKSHRRNWPREQDTFSKTRLISYRETFSAHGPGREKERVEGLEQIEERVYKVLEADKDNISTPHNGTAVEQEKSLTTASREGEQCSQDRGAKTCAVSSLLSQNREDNVAPSVVAVDPRIVHGAAGSSLRSPFQEFSQLGYVTQTTSVPLHYHVQESSPRPRKRFPVHNFREMVWHPSRLYPVVKGVSRDNAKRRWAVYWKGSRKYFYDKLNENCYHAYQQAVNFRKYNYIQHASPGKSLAVVNVSPTHMKDGALLGQSANTNFDASTAVKAEPPYSHHTGTHVLAESVHFDTPFPYESKTPARHSPKDSVALINDTPVAACNTHHPERDARIVRQDGFDRQLEGTCQLVTRKTLPLPEDRGGAFSSLRSSLPRKDPSADPVLDVYKLALLRVLQELKDSLMGLSAFLAPSKRSSSRNDFAESSEECQEDEQTTSCAQSSRQLDNFPSNGLIAPSAESRNPDLRLRPFLLLVVEWHLDNVKLASQPGELEPLISVFSSCFQRLLLPRQAPRPLQQKIYRELMELYNAQALSHLKNA